MLQVHLCLCMHLCMWCYWLIYKIEESYVMFKQSLINLAISTLATKCKKGKLFYLSCVYLICHLLQLAILVVLNTDRLTRITCKDLAIGTSTGKSFPKCKPKHTHCLSSLYFILYTTFKPFPMKQTLWNIVQHVSFFQSWTLSCVLHFHSENQGRPTCTQRSGEVWFQTDLIVVTDNVFRTGWSKKS